MKLNKKGFTLIELIVALAVTVIIIASVGGILYSSYKTFYGITDSNENKMIGDNVYNYLSDKIIVASNLTIVNEQSLILDNDDTVTVDVNGRLLYNGVDVFGDAFYNNKKISFSVAQYSINSVSINVSVWRGSTNIYELGSVIRLLNFEFT